MKTERTPICIKLNAQEMKDFRDVEKATGHGATDIFRAMVKSLKKTLPKPVEEEEI